MGKPFPGPWTFKYHPWLKQCHDDLAEVLVWQKSAQMGVSETAINMAFFWLDILGESVLYLLPNSKPDAADFSVGRFEPALEMSEHIRKMFNDTKNVGMKKANGNAILYIRGSRSESQLKSIPTGRIIYDEFDEMAQGVFALAQERASGQSSRQSLMLSTPTIPEKGINEYYLQSDRKHFFFKCPSCGQYEELTYENFDKPGSLILGSQELNDPRVDESYLACVRTHKPIMTSPEEKMALLGDAIWVPEIDNYQGEYSGYYINQMYSNAAAASTKHFARAAVKATTNPYEAQEFAKSKQGMPYIEKGARLTDEDIKQCIGDYGTKTSAQRGIVTMGVDIGSRIHFEIAAHTFNNVSHTMDINLATHSQVLRAGHVMHFEELDHMMRAYNIIMCVVDAHPEKRKALEFAQRFPGRVKVCFYIEGLSNSRPFKEDIDETYAVKVDRTSWLDLALSRFRNKTISIPADIDQEYSPHLKALVRRYDQDNSGNIIARYVSTGADHLGHARNYNEIALKLAAGIASGQDI